MAIVAASGPKVLFPRNFELLASEVEGIGAQCQAMQIEIVFQLW